MLLSNQLSSSQGDYKINPYIEKYVNYIGRHKHTNLVIIVKLLTGKYFLIISKFTKPIVIHTINVTVEMMMINGTKYPLNLSASCWMGAYKK